MPMSREQLLAAGSASSSFVLNFPALFPQQQTLRSSSALEGHSEPASIPFWH